mmetsp:Transcript_43658/g.95467  ORF Transcript_43658/g.95467 Transcript_43658/m.95467 type:complete len:243 (+) Transcript_43658:678-1406(+)
MRLEASRHLSGEYVVKWGKCSSWPIKMNSRADHIYAFMLGFRSPTRLTFRQVLSVDRSCGFAFTESCIELCRRAYKSCTIAKVDIWVAAWTGTWRGGRRAESRPYSKEQHFSILGQRAKLRKIESLRAQEEGSRKGAGKETAEFGVFQTAPATALQRWRWRIADEVRTPKHPRRNEPKRKTLLSSGSIVGQCLRRTSKERCPQIGWRLVADPSRSTADRTQIVADRPSASSSSCATAGTDAS